MGSSLRAGPFQGGLVGGEGRSSLLPRSVAERVGETVGREGELGGGRREF